ncbi:Ribonuclease H [Mycena kentingensis (nom. inval.)]|nr:Ribonuclease H [Mycena kentingensis (nom. inval.)]
MKRAQDGSPSAENRSNKKAKVSEAGSVDMEGWTKVEKRKHKKEKKMEEKAGATQPRFMYANTEIVKRNHAIGIEDVRDLILHILADASCPNFIRINDSTLIKKVVAVLVPGLTSELLNLPPLPTSATANPNIPISIPLPTAESPSAIPFIASTYSHACPTRAPGDHTRMHSILTAFFQSPITQAELKKRQAANAQRTRDKDPAQYTLTLEQMVENDYPIPSYMANVFQKPDASWAETPQEVPLGLLDAKPQRKVYCVDCEMCLTEDGKELTRVCLIEYYSGVVVYDQLVKPAKPVVDYLTSYFPLLRRTRSRPLPLPRPPHLTPILIGHSLESDLKALKLCHPLCIDTALLYHHPRGRPLKPGLAWLTRKWCGREIQTRGDGGHDPEEDARACLELVQKKVDAGPGFGEFKTDYESIFERMARGGKKPKTAVVDTGNPGVMHGSKATTAIGCKDDEEVLKGMLESVPSHDFVFGRFMGLASLLGWSAPKAEQNAPSLSPTATVPPPPPASALEPVLEALNTQLTTLRSALPARTALVIISGHSDPRKMSLLNARRTAFEQLVKAGTTTAAGGTLGGGVMLGVPAAAIVENGKEEEKQDDIRWSASDGRDLEEAVELARRGLLFLGVVIIAMGKDNKPGFFKALTGRLRFDKRQEKRDYQHQVLGDCVEALPDFPGRWEYAQEQYLKERARRRDQQRRQLIVSADSDVPLVAPYPDHWKLCDNNSCTRKNVMRSKTGDYRCEDKTCIGNFAVERAEAALVVNDRNKGKYGEWSKDMWARCNDQACRVDNPPRALAGIYRCTDTENCKGKYAVSEETAQEAGPIIQERLAFESFAGRIRKQSAGIDEFLVASAASARRSRKKQLGMSAANASTASFATCATAPTIVALSRRNKGGRRPRVPGPTPAELVVELWANRQSSESADTGDSSPSSAEGNEFGFYQHCGASTPLLRSDHNPVLPPNPKPQLRNSPDGYRRTRLLSQPLAFR